MNHAALDEIRVLVRDGVAANEARQEAIWEQSVQLGPGPVNEAWPFIDGSSEIRRSLDRAEKLLEEMVDVNREGDRISVHLPEEVWEPLREGDTAALRGQVIERLHRRLNASWSYIDIVSWEPLVVPDTMPVLFVLTLPLGKPHKGHVVVGEEHNTSGVHFHYTKLDGKRSDILFAFGSNAPKPEYPVKWERHGSGKAKFHPKPEEWNYKKRLNVNEVCCAARATMPVATRYFTPSKNSKFLLPV